MRERGRENPERGERMNRVKTHRKLPSESIPVTIMMQGGEDHAERLSWKGKENVVVGVPFFIEKSENPQGKDLERFLRSMVFLCKSRSEILIYSSRNNSTHDL